MFWLGLGIGLAVGVIIGVIAVLAGMEILYRLEQRDREHAEKWSPP